MKIQSECAKCSSILETDASHWEGISQGPYYALFLGKDKNYVLCGECEKLFINWLKGEPIPKQTTKTDYELKHKPNIEGNQK